MHLEDPDFGTDVRFNRAELETHFVGDGHIQRHCIEGAGGSSSGKHNWVNWNAQTITWGLNVAFTCCAYGGGSIDAGYFRLGNNIPADRNNYFISPTFITTLTSRLANSNQIVGWTICRSGWGSWYAGAATYTCGKITRTDFSWVSSPGGFVIAHAWQLDFRSYHGDSGAGMIYSALRTYYAAGTLVGGSETSPYYTIYNTQETTQSIRGIRPCITDSC